MVEEVLPAWRGDFVAEEDDYGITQDSTYVYNMTIKRSN